LLDGQVTEDTKAAESIIHMQQERPLLVFTRPEGIGPKLLDFRFHGVSAERN
jgi:hypothetical protein